MRKLIVLCLMTASPFSNAFDQIKCVKYMESDQKSVEKMIRNDLIDLATNQSETRFIKKLDTNTLIASGYSMYCSEQNIDMMDEIGAK